MERIKLIQDNYNFSYDSKLIKRNLKVGDKVLVKNQNKTKFELHRIGPYKIIRIAPFGTYKLADLQNRIKTDLVHGDCLKRVEDDDNKEWSQVKKIHLNLKKDSKSEGTLANKELLSK